MNKGTLIASATMLAIGLAVPACAEDIDGSLQKLPTIKRTSLQETIDRVLPDGPATRYRDIGEISGNRLCGRINAKNMLGAYVGYRVFLHDVDAGTLIIDGVGNATSQALIEAACADLIFAAFKDLLKPKP